jgi:hypothetical protein
MSKITIVFILICCAFTSSAQDSIINASIKVSEKFLREVNQKNIDLEEKVDKQTKKYINKLIDEEAKLKKQLLKIDSNSAKVLFSGNPEQQYKSFLEKLNQDVKRKTNFIGGEYQPYTDSLNVVLSFLKSNPALSSNISSQKLQGTIDQLNGLTGKLQGAVEIKQYIQQRKEQIKNYLSKYTSLPKSISKIYRNYNKQLYYYSDQIKSYKDILNDPDKQFNTALIVLNKVPAFSDFVKHNSMLSGLFVVPNNYNGSQPVQGLASREQVMSTLQSQTGGMAPNVNALVQSNTQSAQSAVDEIRSKINQFGASGGDMDMPNFKPNNQKSKSFLKRIELGTNLQTTHASYYFPTTTDIGLSAGYKLNNDNVVGIGMSYKIGWGSDINHIHFSSQGASIRSFIDVKIKKCIFISGGLEANYQEPFYNLDKLKVVNNWQQSGLVGLSYISPIKSSFLKKSKIQLLWDVLSYRQIPRTQPLKFRIGYSF